MEQEVRVDAEGTQLRGTLWRPEGARGIVLFAHGSGSSHTSPRNRFVAGRLQEAGLAALLFDLLTVNEDALDRYTAHLRFNIGLLAERLVAATDWIGQQENTAGLSVGYFGSSTGAAAALMAAAYRPGPVGAVVSRGGRPDLAGPALPLVQAPTLLVVGGDDLPVIAMNQEALARLRVERKLEIVAGASHLFEEPGALEEVARLATAWFVRHLGPRDS